MLYLKVDPLHRNNLFVANKIQCTRAKTGHTYTRTRHIGAVDECGLYAFIPPSARVLSVVRRDPEALGCYNGTGLVVASVDSCYIFGRKPRRKQGG